MGSLTLRVKDPESGVEFALLAYRTKTGKLAFRRLPIQNSPSDTPGVPPRVVEARLGFSRIAQRARGTVFTGNMPPAAELMERLGPSIPEGFESESTSQHGRQQEYYRSLLGEHLGEVSGLVGVREFTPKPRTVAEREQRLRHLPTEETPKATLGPAPG